MLSFDDSFGPLDLSWLDANPAPATPPEPFPCAAEQQRRLRRKISNRLSARRCRQRKQRHLEDLRVELARLRSENRDLASRVAAAEHRCLLVRRANVRLRAESAVLRRRLAELRRLLLFRKLLMASAPAALASLIA